MSDAFRIARLEHVVGMMLVYLQTGEALETDVVRKLIDMLNDPNPVHLAADYWARR